MSRRDDAPRFRHSSQISSPRGASVTGPPERSREDRRRTSPRGAAGSDRAGPPPAPRSSRVPGLRRVGHGPEHRRHLGTSPPHSRLGSRPTEPSYPSGQGDGPAEGQEGRGDHRVRTGALRHGECPPRSGHREDQSRTRRAGLEIAATSAVRSPAHGLVAHQAKGPGPDGANEVQTQPPRDPARARGLPAVTRPSRGMGSWPESGGWSPAVSRPGPAGARRGGRRAACRRSRPGPGSTARARLSGTA